MFSQMTLRGQAPSEAGGPMPAILYGYHQAAVIARWSITKVRHQWRLTATTTRADPWMLRQRHLRFTAPRPHGLWCWPVIGDVQVSGTHLSATLGPPEF